LFQPSEPVIREDTRRTIWGLYYNVFFLGLVSLLTDVSSEMIFTLVPADRRGTAYGYYQGVVGLTLLPASVLAGWLWDTVNPTAPFYLGDGLAFLAMLGLLSLLKEK
jgi:MFS family permease